MGADIKKLRSRIKSVDSTLHLTKAMGLVASSKIRRATENMNQSRAYAQAVEDAVDALTACKECEHSPYMRIRKPEKTCLVVIAGDRGLAGGYNANVFRMLHEVPTDTVIPIGKRAWERFGGEPYLAETFGYAEAMPLARTLCDGFADGRYDRVGILYTKYLSMMAREPKVKWLLPLQKKEGAAERSIVFEPDEVTILNAAIFEYVAATLVAAVRESYASEVAARRFAMDSAGKNATEMLDDLHLRYNRARQGAITQEITEIVAGSDS